MIGRELLITSEQGRRQAALCARYGLETVHLPCIRRLPSPEPERLLEAVRAFAGAPEAWVLFTSRRAVQAFAEAAAMVTGSLNSWQGARFACVGEATGRALEACGGRPALSSEPVDGGVAWRLTRGGGDQGTTWSAAGRLTVSGRGIGHALLELASAAGSRVLLPRSDLASEELPELLREEGCEVVAVVAYRTVPGLAADDAERLEEWLRERRLYAATFTSPSCWRGLWQSLSADGRARFEAEVASFAIGETTATALRADGVEPAGIANPPGLEELVRTVAAEVRPQQTP